MDQVPEDDATLLAESEEELKSLLRRVEKESEKASLKLNIQKTKIIAFGPITSWQIDGRKVEAVTDFIFGSVFKSRDITLPTKVRIVKTIVFPVVMYRCESWTIK